MKKNTAHIARHQVPPDEAEEVLNGDLLLIDSYDIRGEQRVEEVGITQASCILHLVTTIRTGRIRVVTAHDAVKSLKIVFLEYQRSYYE
jgi:uncharacterized DUF497 family protein